MKRYLWLLPLAFALGAGGAALVFTRMKEAQLSMDDSAAYRYQQYCTGLHFTLVGFADDLEFPGDQGRAMRLCGLYFPCNWSKEVELCETSKIDLHELDGCWVRRDHACFARLARASADSIPVRYSQPPSH